MVLGSIPCVVASAAEAEYAAIFAGAQHGAYLSTVLTDLGYPQDPIIIMADNTTATAIGIATDSIGYLGTVLHMQYHSTLAVPDFIFFAK